MITMKKQVCFTRSARGRKRIEDRKESPRLTPSRTPRVSRVMALAIHFDELLRSGIVSNTIVLADLARVTQPRITQVLNLLHLAPDIQEELLLLPCVAEGRDPFNEKRIRRICSEVSFSVQRRMWQALQRTVKGGM